MIEKIIDFCPRCTRDHGAVMFKQFKGNYIPCEGRDYQYWGWCPSNLEPIIISVDDEEIPLDTESQEDTEVSENCVVCGCSSKCQDSKLGTDEAK